MPVLLHQIKAGVRSECLTIALEPEAASVYCKKIQLAKLSEANSDEDGFDIFSPGNQYLILDAGGMYFRKKTIQMLISFLT